MKKEIFNHLTSHTVRAVLPPIEHVHKSSEESYNLIMDEFGSLSGKLSVKKFNKYGKSIRFIYYC